MVCKSESETDSVGYALEASFASDFDLEQTSSEDEDYVPVCLLKEGNVQKKQKNITMF